MSNLVYLICGLPSLTYGVAPPIKNDEFLEEAKTLLSLKNFKKVEKFSLQHVAISSGKGILNKFTTLTDELQKDIHEIRAAKRQKRSPKLINLSKSIMELNPLERELAIIQWQWDELSSLEIGNTFSMTGLIVYKLKLELAHRVFSFNEEDGAKILDLVVNPSQKLEA